MPDFPRPHRQPVAVVGLGALTPGAHNAPEFWRTVLAGRDLIGEVPASHWNPDDYYDPDPDAEDRTYSRRGAFLDPVEFDPVHFGIPPTTLPATDTAHLLALQVAEQVLTDAGVLDGAGPDRERVGVILGTAALELLHTMSNRMQRPVWMRALRASGIPRSRADEVCDRIAGSYVPWQEMTFPGLLSNVVAGRIANRFDLHGTNYTTDAACAGSLAAVSSAVNELVLGNADLVVTGGVDTLNDIVMYMCFSSAKALSTSGDCRPFSDAADGTMMGEALVMFALKRLADAERDGDQVYAVIRGIGSSSDGRGAAIYAPVPEGQARALRRAYESAGYGPDTVELVEAHGTGTAAGDVAEFSALRAVFDESGRTDRQWCALGSVKSQIGHTKSAAGAAGMLKAVLSLQHKVLPPTIKVERPNPVLDLPGSAFHLNTRPRPWIRGAEHPRRASVSSFGFGGTNFHIALEEYLPTGENVARLPDWATSAPTELLLASADSTADLLDRVREIAQDTRTLDVIARETQRSFRADASARLCLVVRDTADLTRQTAQFEDLVRRDPSTAADVPSGLCFDPTPAAPGRIALLFSGQGSQYVGMGADLAMHLPQAREVWDRAADLAFGDRPLHSVVFPPPAFTDDDNAAQEALLTRTRWAQPALAAYGAALLSVLRSVGVEPDYVAGHSVGELGALHAANVFDETTLLRLTRERGELMSEVETGPGAMLAVEAPPEDVERLVEDFAGRIWIANLNSPRQVVVSGHTDAIAAFETRLSDQGVPIRRLQASGAFHSPLLDAARAPFLEVLHDCELRPPALPVYGNADADRYPSEPDLIRSRLADHLVTPVRFADQVRALHDAGVRTFVEVGPRSTLSRLVTDILGERPHLAIGLDRHGVHGMTALQRGLGRLAVAGVRLDLAPLREPYGSARPAGQEPRGARMSVPISGTNYGKPQPLTESTATPLPEPSAEPMPMPPAEPMPMPPAEPMPTPARTPLPQVVVRSPEPLVSGWAHAFEETQRLASQAHADYQRVMAETHLSYLRVTENSLRALLGHSTEDTEPLARTVGPDTFATAVPVATAPLAPAPEPLPPPTTAPVPLDGPVPTAPTVHEQSPAIVDVATVFLDIVAEKTGYPREVLEPHLELESDLGIDSIKRVEILALLRKRAVDMPEVDAAELAGLRTLGDIADRYQVEAAQPKPAPESTRPSRTSAAVRRAVTVMSPALEPGLELPGLRNGKVAVVDGGSGLAELMVERLRRHAVDAVVAPSHDTDVSVLLLLAGLRPVASADEAMAVNQEAFGAARTVAKRFAERGGTLVAVQDTGGDFGLAGAGDRAWLGGLAGLARTAAKEWEHGHGKVVDVERGERSPEETADALVAELLRGGVRGDIGLRADGSRWAVRDEPRLATDQPDVSPVRPGSVILATGGGRGVTAIALTALAEAYRPTLVLLGCTELAEEAPHLAGITDERELRRRIAELPATPGAPRPGPAEIAASARRVLAVREIRSTVAALEAAGSVARYLSVDIRDADALGAALDQVRAEFGPVTGLVHGAGVLADARIEDKTDAQFDRVFDTKVAGLRSLLSATSCDPLDLVCVFSSVAGRFGNVGQADYAMANEALAHVAAEVAARRPRCLVRSFAWGPWDGGMVGPELREHFLGRGIELIAPAAGAAAFVRDLEAGPGPVRVTIVAGDRPDAFGDDTARRPVGEVMVTARTHPYLVDHAVAGTPVLPMALVLDWFLGAARALLLGTDVVALRDVEVVRGVPLPHLADGGHRLGINAQHERSGDETRLRLDLTDVDGQVRYRATARSAAGGTHRDRVPANDLRPFAGPALYEGKALFHGPAFQALGEPLQLSASGARAPVSGVRAVDGWPEDGWHTDPVAVDAALQLALVWASELGGGRYLPMSVTEVRGPWTGPLDRVAQGLISAVEVDVLRPVCDVALLDGDGAVLVELLGVALVRRPDPEAVEPGNADAVSGVRLDS